MGEFIELWTEIPSIIQVANPMSEYWKTYLDQIVKEISGNTPLKIDKELNTPKTDKVSEKYKEILTQMKEKFGRSKYTFEELAYYVKNGKIK